MSFPSQKARRGTSQHTSLCWRAARDVNRHVRPLSTKCSVFNIALEGRDFWLVFTQSLSERPLRVKSYLMQGIIFCSCVHVYVSVDAYSPSTTAVAHHLMSDFLFKNGWQCSHFMGNLQISLAKKTPPTRHANLKFLRFALGLFCRTLPPSQSRICCIACCSLYK